MKFWSQISFNFAIYFFNFNLLNIFNVDQYNIKAIYF